MVTVLANSSFTHFLVLLIGPQFLVQSSYRFVFSFSMFLYLRTFLLTLCRCLTWPEVSRRALCLYLCVDVCGLHGDLWQGDCQVVKVVSSQAVKWRKWILEHSFRFSEDLMWIEFVLLLFYLVQMQRSTGHKGSRVETHCFRLRFRASWCRQVEVIVTRTGLLQFPASVSYRTGSRGRVVVFGLGFRSRKLWIRKLLYYLYELPCVVSRNNFFKHLFSLKDVYQLLGKTPNSTNELIVDACKT